MTINYRAQVRLFNATRIHVASLVIPIPELENVSVLIYQERYFLIQKCYFNDNLPIIEFVEIDAPMVIK